MYLILAIVAGLFVSAGVLFFLFWFHFKWKHSWHETSVLFFSIIIFADILLQHNLVLYILNLTPDLVVVCSWLFAFIFLFTFASILLFFVRYFLHAPIRTLLCLVIVTGIVLLIIKIHPLDFAAKMFYTPQPLTFEGGSDQLSRTEIVPSLDTPMTPGKNVIWCASWTMVWKEIQNTLAKEPVIVERAEDFSQRMNNAPDFTQDLPPDDWYAKAGWVDQGAIQTIYKDMAQYFPEVPKPDFREIAQDSFLGYAFLKSKIKFKIPYEECRLPVAFSDSQGKTTQLQAFGFDGHTVSRYRSQIKRLYCENIDPKRRGLFHYALDLCAEDPVYQVVLAIIPAQATLEATLKYLEDKMSAPSEFDVQVGYNDALRVPEMAFHVNHRFNEIIKHAFKNESMRHSPIDDAYLDIMFRLDRNGVELLSQAGASRRCMPIDYDFSKPFLVYLKKRGASRPYFVMWVDNDELLRKDSGKK